MNKWWCPFAHIALKLSWWHTLDTLTLGAISCDGCTLLLQTDGRVLCLPAPTRQVKHNIMWCCNWVYPSGWRCGYFNSVMYSDSPQVQCIQSYSSQEPDELSIEMADVLNLLERTDDGLYNASMITTKKLRFLKYIFHASFSTFCLAASFILQAGWWERDSMMAKGAGSPVDLWKRSRAKRFVLRTWEKLSGFSRPKREEVAGLVCGLDVVFQRPPASPALGLTRWRTATSENNK